MTDADLCRRIFAAGVVAADPFAAVQRHIASVQKPSQIIAVGKAAVRMSEAALAAFPDVPALVVTNYENARDLPDATVLAAGHPVPDANGEAAGKAVMAALSATIGPILALISGGGSALLPAPVSGVSLDEKAHVNSALLGAGMDITQMNLVRQQLSQLKGGGLLRMANGPVTALILSDVVGDDLSTIASGPTVAPLGTAADAVALLKDAGIWAAMPPSVQRHLSAETPRSERPEARNILVGSNALSVAAMADVTACKVLGAVEGDVADAARLICESCDAGVTIWGGETTVVLRGSGRGGRNQELALRIAIEAKARGWTDWTCLQAGSDGRDGPTDAAGGLVDAMTLDKIDDAKGDINALLANNDSYAALGLADALLITDATGTNVADLGVMIRR